MLKTRALQTLLRPSKTAAWREAFGVRAALAPLFRVRDKPVWFKGSKRKLSVGRILTPAFSSSEGEREEKQGARKFLERPEHFGSSRASTFLFA